MCENEKKTHDKPFQSGEGIKTQNPFFMVVKIIYSLDSVKIYYRDCLGHKLESVYHI